MHEILDLIHRHGDIHDVLDLIHRHGNVFYLITFLWTALEGETFVIFAGFAAQKGLLNIGFLFIAAWLGSLCGDQIFFLLGRKFGTRVLDHLPRFKPGVEHALGWLENHAVIFILSYRFMYGLRNVSSIAVGLSHLSWKKFALWNSIAAFVWAASFTGAGYIFGDVLAHFRRRADAVVQDRVHQIMLSGLGLFILVVVGQLIMIAWQQRRREKAKSAEISPPDLNA